MDKQDILNAIKTDWGDAPPGYACDDIVNYFFNNDTKYYQPFTFRRIHRITHKKHTPEDLISALQYLSGDKLRLFEIEFQFIDNSEGTVYDIDKKILKAAMDTGDFYHPKTGIKVSNYKKYIYPVYAPNLKRYRVSDS